MAELKNFETIHTNVCYSNFTNLMKNALSENKITKTSCNFRIIRVGAGLVLLPEANCEQFTTENEIRKALHLPNNNTACPIVEPEKKINVKIGDSYGEEDYYLKLTKAQTRLLEFLLDHNILCDNCEVEFDPQDIYEEI